MNEIKIGKIFAWLIISIVLIGGCVTVEERPLTEGLTKIKIQQSWKRKPDKVYHANANKLKYGADELWEYEYSGGGDVDRFYFKDSVLIKEEHLTYGDF